MLGNITGVGKFELLTYIPYNTCLMSDIERGFIRLKTREDLINQVTMVSGELGEPITQPFQNEDVFSIPPYDLRERFTARYRIYLDTLRRVRRNDKSDHSSVQTLQLLNSLDRYIYTHNTDGSNRTLREHQLTVFDRLRDFLEQDGTEGYIRLPTGTGKTVLFAEFVEATNLQTLVVVPTRILVDQTDERFNAFAPTVLKGKVYTGEKTFGRPVTITTYASLLRNISNDQLKPDEYELLILDEVHKSITQRRMSAIDEFTRAVKIGFTATPKYSEDKHVGNLLDTEIYNMGVKEAIEEGLLTSLSVYIAKTDIDLSNVRITSTGNYNDEDLEKKVNIASRNQAAVELYDQLFNGEQAIAYCVSVRHAEDLMRMFQDKNITVGVISGYQPKREQQDVLSRFKSGEIKVLCNADILIEGYDDSAPSVCLNLRPTTSPVIAEQRAGRVLRLNSDKPNKHAYIIDFVDYHKNADNLPVCFAQIIESAHVYRKSSTQYDLTGSKSGIKLYPDISIAGLRVITETEEVMRLVHEMEDRKYKPPEEGWLNFDALSRRFRFAEVTIQKLVGPFRESHPEYFSIRKGRTGHFSEYLAPELVEFIREKRAAVQAPVEGWVSLNAICHELGMVYSTLMKALKESREKNSNDFRVFRMSNGNIVECISPQQVEIIRAQFQISKPPQGWINYPDLARVLGVSLDTVRRIARAYGVSDPDKIKTFRVKSGKMLEHVSPDLAEKIKEERQNIGLPENGWTTSKRLAKAVGTSYGTINAIANKFRQIQPDSYRFFKVANGNIVEHFSPGLVVLIKNERTALANHKAGWVDYQTLAKELGVTKRSAVLEAEKYSGIYPQYFGLFLGANQKVTHCVSPELVDLLKGGIGSVPEVEPGWVNNSALSKDIGTSRKAISTFVSQFRVSNPEYFKIARGAQRRIIEHFSPELVERTRIYFSVN